MIMLLLSAGILDNNNPSTTTIESHMEKVSYQNYF